MTALAIFQYQSAVDRANARVSPCGRWAHFIRDLELGITLPGVEHSGLSASCLKVSQTCKVICKFSFMLPASSEANQHGGS